MSNLKIKTTPGEFVVAGNQNIFKVIAPNKYTTGIYTPGYVQLQIATGHVNGNKMTFTNAFGSVTMTCSTVPGYDATTYKAYTSGDLYTWVTELVSYLKKNPFLVRHYDIVHDAIQQNRIYFKARIKGDEPEITLTDQPADTTLVNNMFVAGLVLPDGYKMVMLAEKQIDSQWGSGFDYKEMNGPFDYSVREPLLSEVAKDPTNYIRAAVLECDVKFLLKQYLTGHYSFPEPSTVIYKEWDILEWRRFYFFDKSGIPEVDGMGITSEPIYSLPGKFSELKQSIINNDYNGFENWLNATGSFLTFSPVSKYMDANQPERLYWLSRKTETVKYKITHTYTDNSTATFTTSINMIKGRVYEFYLNWEKARMGVSNKVIAKFRVYIENSSDIRISEPRDYFMDTSYRPWARYFFFRNSFGVYECIRVDGTLSKTVNISKETTRRELLPGFTSKDVQEVVSSVSAENIYTVNSGYLTPEIAVYFQEFLKSDNVLMLRNGRIFPVVITPIKAGLYMDDEQNVNIPFELRHSINDDFAINLDVYSSAYNRDFNNDFSSDFNK